MQTVQRPGEPSSFHFPPPPPEVGLETQATYVVFLPRWAPGVDFQLCGPRLFGFFFLYYFFFSPEAFVAQFFFSTPLTSRFVSCIGYLFVESVGLAKQNGGLFPPSPSKPSSFLVGLFFLYHPHCGAGY